MINIYLFVPGILEPFKVLRTFLAISVSSNSMKPYPDKFITKLLLPSGSPDTLSFINFIAKTFAIILEWII